MIRSRFAQLAASALALSSCGASSDDALEIRFPDSWTVLQEPTGLGDPAGFDAESMEASWPAGCDFSYIGRLISPEGGIREQAAVAVREGDLLVNVLLWRFDSEGEAAAFVETYRSAPDACWTWSLSDGAVPVEGAEVDITFSSGRGFDYHAEVITDVEDRPLIGVEAQVLIANDTNVLLFFTQPNQFGSTNQSYLDVTLEAFKELGEEY